MAKKNVYFFGAGKAEGKADMKNLLGGKGANLAEMCNLDIPVPAGFTITTEMCVEYYKNSGHGGGDFVIQRDLLDEPSPESLELKLVAGSEDGARAIALGEAVWRSIREKRPIRIPELLAGLPVNLQGV